MIKASLHPMYHSICVNMSDKNVHTCPWLCVVSTQTWVFRLSQDYVARLRVRMGSKITHGEGYKGSGARNGLWPGVTFLGDLINCYTGKLSSPSKPTTTQPRRACGPSWNCSISFPCAQVPNLLSLPLLFWILHFKNWLILWQILQNESQ